MSEIKPWKECIGKHDAYIIMCNVLDDLYEKEAIKKAVYERLRQAPSIDRWIPCSERLPKIEENPVLVTSMGLVGMGWYRNGDWLTSTNLPFFDVVAWMPLPEAYREDGE